MIHCDKEGAGTGSDDKPYPTLSINSYADVFEHEGEILRRIQAVPNGGNLFMIHPFMLFGEIGVELTAKARDEIIFAEPGLKNLAEAPYRALRTSTSPQRLRIHLKGLFPRLIP